MDKFETVVVGSVIPRGDSLYRVLAVGVGPRGGRRLLVVHDSGQHPVRWVDARWRTVNPVPDSDDEAKLINAEFDRD